MTLSQYLDSVLAIPRSELGGHSICPFIRQYRDRVIDIEIEDYSVAVAVSCELLEVLNLEAVVISGPDCDYDWLDQKHQEWNKKYRKMNREILFMFPDTVDPPLNLEYNWPNSPLVIVQRRDSLQRARKYLKQHTNYYDYYG